VVTSEPVGAQGLGQIDAAVEELRHATYGLFGPTIRARLLERLGWEWSPIHYRVLRIVEGTDPMRPTAGEVAAAVLVDKARATRLVGQLREAGLVTSAVGRLDRRRREVELTGAGRELLAEARRLRLQFLGEALQAWNHADVEALASLIERFNVSIREAAW
jgi:DNA-binding MarR family transcriptional regulator